MEKQENQECGNFTQSILALPKATKIFYAIGIVVLIIGIILAFCSEEIQLLESVIIDAGETPVGIGGHVFVIFALLASSGVLFFFANEKNPYLSNSIKQKMKLSYLIYAITGMLFSIATGYSERSSQLWEYYERVNSEPKWYSYSIITAPGFDKLPSIANKFENISIVFYVLTLAGIIALSYSIYSVVVNQNDQNS